MHAVRSPQLMMFVRACTDHSLDDDLLTLLTFIANCSMPVAQLDFHCSHGSKTDWAEELCTCLCQQDCFYLRNHSDVCQLTLTILTEIVR